MAKFRKRVNSKQIPRYTEFILNEVKGFARNDGVRVWKKGKGGAALPLLLFPSPLKNDCHPEPKARDLLAIDRSVFENNLTDTTDDKTITLGPTVLWADEAWTEVQDECVRKIAHCL